MINTKKTKKKADTYQQKIIKEKRHSILYGSAVTNNFIAIVSHRSKYWTGNYN